MKKLNQTLPLLLAAALQILPLLRNIVTSTAASSSFAFILRWTIGSSAAIGAFDACSGASNYFTSPTNFTGTVGVPFTNNLTILSSGSDSGAVTTITSNGVSVFLTANGQTSTFALPPGLTMKFVDKNPIYNAMYGTPTTVGTNSFNITMSYPGQTSLSTNITIRITAGGSLPVITNQPGSITNVAGGNATFTVLAGTAPLFYRWYFNTNTSLLNATNASLNLTNIRVSQAGFYSVVITNGSGAITSSPAQLTVTTPASPPMMSPGVVAGMFQFTFNPVVGLTNSVMTNNAVSGGSWVVMTNVPPPTTTNPVTVTDAITGTNRFYRIQIIP
jgi:hypothetical protein